VSAADGPLPIGDAIGLAILFGAAVYDLSYYCSPEYAFRDVAVDVPVDVRVPRSNDKENCFCCMVLGGVYPHPDPDKNPNRAVFVGKMTKDRCKAIAEIEAAPIWWCDITPDCRHPQPQN
jgi:hypothetical protein